MTDSYAAIMQGSEAERAKQRDMTDSTSLAAQLEALAEKAAPGPLMMYGEPDVGMRTEPFFGTPMNGDMRPLADWRAYDADLVVALWNNLPAIITALHADQRCAELEAENARLREVLVKAGPIHAGPVGGELGRKYPAARQCVIEFAPEQASGAYDLQITLARIRAALGENRDG